MRLSRIIRCVLFFQLAIFCAVAQTTQKPYCGTEMSKLENGSKQNATLKNLSKAEIAKRLEQGLATIPVVFHVVLEPIVIDDNCNDAGDLNQILSSYGRDDALCQIQELNNAFTDVGGNIEFGLATHDTGGNDFCGVTYRTNIRTYNGDNLDEMDDRFPSNEYLNIWIVNRLNTDNTLGVYFDDGRNDGANERIIMAYAEMGNYSGSCEADVPKEFGNVLIHEVGHWLGLAHTWGNNNNVGNMNNCDIDDGDRYADPDIIAMCGCSDTPNSNGYVSNDDTEYENLCDETENAGCLDCIFNTNSCEEINDRCNHMNYNVCPDAAADNPTQGYLFTTWQFCIMRANLCQRTEMMDNSNNNTMACNSGCPDCSPDIADITNNCNIAYSNDEYTDNSRPILQLDGYNFAFIRIAGFEGVVDLEMMESTDGTGNVDIYSTGNSFGNIVFTQPIEQSGFLLPDDFPPGTGFNTDLTISLQDLPTDNPFYIGYRLTSNCGIDYYGWIRMLIPGNCGRTTIKILDSATQTGGNAPIFTGQTTCNIINDPNCTCGASIAASDESFVESIDMANGFEPVIFFVEPYGNCNEQSNVFASDGTIFNSNEPFSFEDDETQEISFNSLDLCLDERTDSYDISVKEYFESETGIVTDCINQYICWNDDSDNGTFVSSTIQIIDDGEEGINANFDVRFYFFGTSGDYGPLPADFGISMDEGSFYSIHYPAPVGGDLRSIVSTDLDEINPINVVETIPMSRFRNGNIINAANAAQFIDNDGHIPLVLRLGCGDNRPAYLRFRLDAKGNILIREFVYALSPHIENLPLPDITVLPCETQICEFNDPIEELIFSLNDDGTMVTIEFATLGVENFKEIRYTTDNCGSSNFGEINNFSFPFEECTTYYVQANFCEQCLCWSDCIEYQSPCACEFTDFQNSLNFEIVNDQIFPFGENGQFPEGVRAYDLQIADIAWTVNSITNVVDLPVNVLEICSTYSIQIRFYCNNIELPSEFGGNFSFQHKPAIDLPQVQEGGIVVHDDGTFSVTFDVPDDYKNQGLVYNIDIVDFDEDFDPNTNTISNLPACNTYEYMLVVDCGEGVTISSVTGTFDALTEDFSGITTDIEIFGAQIFPFGKMATELPIGISSYDLSIGGTEINLSTTVVNLSDFNLDICILYDVDIKLYCGNGISEFELNNIFSFVYQNSDKIILPDVPLVMQGEIGFDATFTIDFPNQYKDFHLLYRIKESQPGYSQNTPGSNVIINLEPCTIYEYLLVFICEDIDGNDITLTSRNSGEFDTTDCRCSISCTDEDFTIELIDETINFTYNNHSDGYNYSLNGVAINSNNGQFIIGNWKDCDPTDYVLTIECSPGLTTDCSFTIPQEVCNNVIDNIELDINESGDDKLIINLGVTYMYNAQVNITNFITDETIELGITENADFIEVDLVLCSEYELELNICCGSVSSNRTFEFVIGGCEFVECSCPINDCDINNNKIIFFDEEENEGDIICELNLNETTVNFEDDNSPCDSDKVESAIIRFAPAGKVIKIYDNSNANTNDDWLEIEFFQNVEELIIPTFEQSFVEIGTNNQLSVSGIYHNDNNNLNNEVSRVEIDCDASGPIIDFYGNDFPDDLMCSLEIGACETFNFTGDQPDNMNCNNDKAENIILHNIPAGTVITLFNNTKSNDDCPCLNPLKGGWLQIEVVNDLDEFPISNLELSDVDNEDVVIRYSADFDFLAFLEGISSDNNDVTGKISYVEINTVDGTGNFTCSGLCQDLIEECFNTCFSISDITLPNFSQENPFIDLETEKEFELVCNNGNCNGTVQNPINGNSDKIELAWEACTDYDLQIRARCDDNLFSNWVPVEFTSTGCLVNCTCSANDCNSFFNRIDLFESENATGESFCSIEFNTNLNSFPCDNDKAQSAILFNIPAGTTIKIFGNSNGNVDEGWTEINVKNDLAEKTINSFFESFEDDDLSITYHNEDYSIDNNTYGVSSLEIGCEASGPIIDLYIDEDGKNLMCSVDISENCFSLNLNTDNMCNDNDAESLVLHNMPAGTVITLYEMATGNLLDGGWVKICVNDFIEELLINDFEQVDQSFDDVDISYSIDFNQNTDVNNEISFIEVRLEGSTCGSFVDQTDCSCSLGACTNDCECDHCIINDNQIIFFSQPGRMGTELCRLSVHSGFVFEFEDGWCQNDEAQSAILRNVPKGKVFKIYDNRDGMTNDDWLEIIVNEDIIGDHIINDFETSIDNEDAKVRVIFHNDGSDLNGQVSRYEVFCEPTGAVIDFYENIIENDNPEELSCSYELSGTCEEVEFARILCKDNEANALILHDISAATVITLFDIAEEGSQFSGAHLQIEALVDISHKVIPNLDGQETDNQIMVTHFNGDLNGKVSLMLINYNSIACIDFCFTPVYFDRIEDATVLGATIDLGANIDYEITCLTGNCINDNPITGTGRFVDLDWLPCTYYELEIKRFCEDNEMYDDVKTISFTTQGEECAPDCNCEENENGTIRNNCFNRYHTIEFFEDRNFGGDECSFEHSTKGLSLIENVCTEDNGESLIINNISAGKVIRLFDNSDGKTDDDWLEIEITADANQITIPTLEPNINPSNRPLFENGNEVGRITYHIDNNLNDRVSSYSINCEPSGPLIDFYKDEDPDNDLMCSLPIQSCMEFNFHEDTFGNDMTCSSDDARSFRLFNIPANWRIILYKDTPDDNHLESSWLQIETKTELQEFTIMDFEDFDQFDNGEFCVTFSDQSGNLTSEVSYMTIEEINGEDCFPEPDMFIIDVDVEQFTQDNPNIILNNNTLTNYEAEIEINTGLEVISEIRSNVSSTIELDWYPCSTYSLDIRVFEDEEWSEWYTVPSFTTEGCTCIDENIADPIVLTDISPIEISYNSPNALEYNLTVYIYGELVEEQNNSSGLFTFNLDDCTEYYYYISILCEDNSWSAPIGPFDEQTGNCPINCEAVSTDNLSVTIDCDNVCHIVSNQDELSIQHRYAVKDANNWIEVDPSISGVSSIDVLPDCGIYEFQIREECSPDSNTWSEWSASKEYTIVHNVDYTSIDYSISDSDITLSAGTGSNVIQFEYSINGTTYITEQINNGSFTINNVNANDNVCFKVRRWACNNMPACYSDEICVNDTGAEPPGGNTNLFVTYDWINELVNPDNCNGASITVLEYSGTIYIVVSDPLNEKLYREDGTLICSQSGCVTVFAPGATTIDTWSCVLRPNRADIKSKIATGSVDFTKQGAGNLKTAYKFNIIPNPATNQVYIYLNDDYAKQNQSIHIFDLTGQKIHQIDLDEENYKSIVTFDFTNAAKGMYLVKWQSNNAFETQKLIIN